MNNDKDCRVGQLTPTGGRISIKLVQIAQISGIFLLRAISTKKSDPNIWACIWKIIDQSLEEISNV